MDASARAPRPPRSRRSPLGDAADSGGGETPAKPTEAAVPQDSLRGVVPGGRHHPAAGVGAGPAQVQAVHRGRVLGEEGGRAHESHLVEALLALEDGAADEAEDSFQVRRSEHAHRQRVIWTVVGTIVGLIVVALLVWLVLHIVDEENTGDQTPSVPTDSFSTKLLTPSTAPPTTTAPDNGGNE